MSHSALPDHMADSQDRVLAQLLNDALERVQAGRSVDVEALAAEWPQYAAELRRLLPVMQTCAQISGGGASGGLEGLACGRLGDFLIQRELGRGGMGIVYEAQQISLRRRVALKVLPFVAVLDSRQLRRFHNEAQAAALLHHPQIVPVYGVGCERGVHYYAMQLIEGPTLAHVIGGLRSQAGLDSPAPDLAANTPCVSAEGTHDAHTPPVVPRAPDDHDAVGGTNGQSSHPTASPQGILSTAHSHRSSAFIQAAVQLGIDVAEALDYAHHEGVLHRDIKPGNLLLDERGRVWVTDFGLARIEADPSLTLAGDLVGTLRYMSPEQALGQLGGVDGRTDVYALGATLYELLTLEPVFDRGDKQMLLRQIASEEPRPLRQRERSLPVELETIILKALAKNPSDRYLTAGALADDLRRFLEHKPIQARRPTLVDRATKWALRNRRLVLAGALGLLLAVVTLLVASLLIWNEQHKTQHALETAIAEKERADQQAAIARAVNAFLQEDLLSQADVSNQLGIGASPDPNIKVRTLLDRASQAIEGKFADQPLLKASIHQTIGVTYRGLGLYSQAAQHLEQAFHTRHTLLGEEHAGTLQAMHELALAYDREGKYPKAEGLTTQVLTIRRRVQGPEHPNTLKSMNHLATLYQAQARYAEAELLLTECLEIQRRVLGPEHLDTLASMNNLAGLYQAQGKYAEAEPLFTQCLEIVRRVHGLQHPATLASMQNLAVLYRVQARYSQAEPLLTQCLEITRRVQGPEHPDTLRAMINLAGLYQLQARFAEAEPLLTQSLEITRRVLGAEHPTTVSSMNNLALLYQAQTRYSEAEPLLTQCLDILRRVLGPEHPHTLQSMHNLAALCQDQARYAEAELLVTQAVEIRRRVLGPEHPDTLQSMNNLAALYWSLHKLEKSIPLFEETHNLERKIWGEDHPETLLTAANLGVNYMEAGRLDEALPLLEAGYRAATAYPSLRWVAEPLLDGYVQAQRAEQAEVLAQELLTHTRATLPQESAQLAPTLAIIAQSLLQVKAWIKAEPVLRECLAYRERREPDAWTTSNTRSMLGATLLGQQKYTDAEPLLVQGYEGMKQREDEIPAEGKVRVIEALERLAQLYEALEKPDEAAKWRSELEATRQRLASDAS